MIRKVFRQMLVAQILSSMTVMICMLVDSLMIGRFLGVDSMTAYGLASPVLLVFAAVGSMLSAVHKEGEEEKLHLLMVDPHIPAGAKLY